MRSRQCVATSRAFCREPGTGGSALLQEESYLITRTPFKVAAMTHTPYQARPTTMQQHQVRNFQKGRGRGRGCVLGKGGMHGWRPEWQGGHAQQGAYMAGEMHGRGCAWWGWCVARGYVWLGACMAGDHVWQEVGMWWLVM